MKQNSTKEKKIKRRTEFNFFLIMFLFQCVIHCSVGTSLCKMKFLRCVNINDAVSLNSLYFSANAYTANKETS